MKNVIFRLVSDYQAALNDVDELSAFVNVVSHIVGLAFRKFRQIRLHALFLRRKGEALKQVVGIGIIRSVGKPYPFRSGYHYKGSFSPTVAEKEIKAYI